MNTILLSLIMMGYSALLSAQPATQIYLAKIKLKAVSTKLGVPQKISKFAGYNNQPMFSPNGKTLYYTANQGGKQTDIFAYKVKSGKTIQLIDTPTSEYSPTITPDGKHFSCIMVEPDGTQRLWKYPLKSDQKNTPQLVLKSVKPIGYHLWVNSDVLVLFVLGAQGQPHHLQLASLQADQGETLATDIGRCFGYVPQRKHAISFVHKPKNKQWKIKKLDTKTKKITSIVPTLKGSEDYVWAKKERVIMGQGTKLYIWKKDKGWKLFANLKGTGIKKITRLAINPSNSLLAIVGE
ncbi:TolB family protein [Microscilla marina]|nr:PD40 domain-containing protein [Microscilla marina]